MERITEAQLQALVNRINAVTGNPQTPWSKPDHGQIRANVGNYHLDFCYGKVQVQQTVNESGGVRTITSLGTKREVYYELLSFLQGYYVAREAALQTMKGAS